MGHYNVGQYNYWLSVTVQIYVQPLTYSKK